MAASAQSDFRYDPFSDAAMRRPTDFYPVLRDQHPAYFIPEYDTWVFSRFDDVWQGYMDFEHFSEAEGMLFKREQLLTHHRGNPPEPRLAPVKDMFLNLDPPIHTGVRRSIGKPFQKGSINKLEAKIETLVNERLDALIPMGKFDLNGDFASIVAVSMVCHVLGLEPDDPAALAHDVNNVVGLSHDPEALAKVIERINVVLMSAIQRRRAGEGPPSPVIDGLIQLDGFGREMTDAEIAVDLRAILVGGTETVPKILAGGLLELSRRPQQLAQVRAGMPESIAPAFEEMLRYNAPAQWFGRLVKKPVTLGGVELEPGQRVILIIASANRDPREFDNADDFLWNRKARRLLSFGVGPHFCIGMHLARLEGQVMLREFLTRVEKYTVHPDEGDWPVSEFQIGWTSLPVTIEAGA